MLHPNKDATILSDLIEKFFDPETSYLEQFLIVGAATVNHLVGFVNGKRIPFIAWKHFALRLLSGVIKSSAFADRHYRGLAVTVGTGASMAAHLDHNLVATLIMESGQPALYATTFLGPPVEKKRKALVARWSVPVAGDFGYGLGRILRKLSAP